jgi:uncharacterized LabA/DUF88 family protein
MWRAVTNLPVAQATIHSPVAVSLPTGIHRVSGGSLTRSARLAVASYPPRNSKIKRRAVTPLPDALIAEVHAVEEKGSDVNLASHLLNDAWKGDFDQAVVISNDTDLVEPIRMVIRERGKSVVVVCPGRWQMAKELDLIASFKVHLRPSMLRAAQFPNVIPGTAISKPASW